jgi:hypothetical protein
VVRRTPCAARDMPSVVSRNPYEAMLGLMFPSGLLCTLSSPSSVFCSRDGKPLCYSWSSRQGGRKLKLGQHPASCETPQVILPSSSRPRWQTCVRGQLARHRPDNAILVATVETVDNSRLSFRPEPDTDRVVRRSTPVERPTTTDAPRPQSHVCRQRVV